MKTYQHYNVEDFLTDNWFLAWVKHNQPDARQFWEEWQRQNPEQRATLLLAKDMAEALKNRPNTLSVEQEQLEIEQIVRLSRHVPNRSRWSVLAQSYGWVAAAVVLLVAGISWWTMHGRILPTGVAAHTDVAKTDKSLRDNWADQVNGTSQPIRIALPDGSQMTLMANSQASYPRSFNTDKREVHLKGDALFSVIHEGKRPFLVYSGTLITRVLGTQFRVQARPGEKHMKVSVISGKVSVMDQRDWTASQKSSNTNQSGVVLTANQQVTYDPSQHRYQKELVARPAIIDARFERAETFAFEDTPATTVFERLKKAYGVEIIYDETTLHHCTLTASLAGVTLYDQLQLLCASIGATYEVVDTRIIITSKGCS